MTIYIAYPILTLDPYQTSFVDFQADMSVSGWFGVRYEDYYMIISI